MGPAAHGLRLPYFDVLLQQLAAGEPRFLEAFGRHVHWGHWRDPARSDGSVADFAAAAERLCQLVCAGAGPRDGWRVLDAGCGFGGTVASLNEQWRDLEVVGLNLDPRQLERAAARVSPRAGNRIRWLCADACALPSQEAGHPEGLADGQLDAVLAVECIFHFPSRERFFGECARVLRPGGRLALSDFVPNALLRPLVGGPAGGPASDLITATYGTIDSRCSPRGYRELARRHGFRPLLDQDITPGTLPTYPVVADLFRSVGEVGAARATDVLAWLGRLGLLRYRVMAFERLPEGGLAAPSAAT
jgi:SAM-dependent methyltransferase